MIQLVGMSGLDVEGHPLLSPPFDRPYDFTLAHDSRTFADMLTPRGLSDVARYAAGIGPEKSYLLPTRCAPDDANGCDASHRLALAPTRIVADAHAAGLLVHPFTFHSDVRRMGPELQNAALREYQAFYDLGVDGVITDFPDTAVLARNLNEAQLRVAMTRVQ
jgi:glycerophosphoryl diester phosphodiesterase